MVVLCMTPNFNENLFSKHPNLLAIIKFLGWAIDMTNSQMTHFLWNNNEDKHRYHLANWQLIAQKKEFEGFGIPDVRSFNLALLSSCLLGPLDTSYILAQFQPRL